MVAADARSAMTFSLPPGNAGDAPEGRKLLKTLDKQGWKGSHVIMDKVCEWNETQQLALALDMVPVAPQSNRLTKGGYDKELYKKRNEVDRLFRRLKGFLATASARPRSCQEWTVSLRLIRPLSSALTLIS